MFSGFSPLSESFLKSAFIEDLRLDRFLRFDLIFDGLSSMPQMFLINISLSMETISLTD